MPNDLAGPGITCPECSYPCDIVADTRKRDGFVWRRRECIRCGFRVTTREITVELEKMVVVEVPLRIRWALNGKGLVAETVEQEEITGEGDEDD